MIGRGQPVLHASWQRRVLPVLLGLLLIPLLACGPLAAVAGHPPSSGTLPPSIPIAFDDLPPTAPCRIAAEFAVTTHGKPYSQGGNLPGDPIDPATGRVCSRTGPTCYDCSGMTQSAYARAGVMIGPTTYYQVHDGVAVPCTPADLDGPNTRCWATGDLVLFLRSNGTPYHVEMYIRDGYFSACLNHRDGCRFFRRSPTSFPAIVVRRIVPDCSRPLLAEVAS